MKLKIIRAFFAVYLALSMVYSGARAAYLTVMAAMEPPDRAEEQIELEAPSSFGVDTVPAEPKLPEVVIPSPDILPEDTPPVSEELSEPESEVTNAPSPEETAEADEDTEPEGEPAIAEEIPEEPEKAEEGTIDAEEVEEPAETLIAPPEAEPDQETASIEAAPAQDIPSLEDYLSTLHCGRCGRNCFLSNPRCRTGRSKAQSATEEYYAEYGVSEDI